MASLTDAPMEYGTMSSEQIDEIIAGAVAARLAKQEQARREDWRGGSRMGPHSSLPTSTFSVTPR
jgi:hypothetical protein